MTENVEQKRRIPLSRTFDRATVLLMGTIALLIIVLALLILFHQNANATKGYLLRSLERDRTNLLRDEEILNLDLAKEQSLQFLEASEKIQNMVAPQDVQYIEL